jgi:glutathione S-transferase
MKLRYSQSSPYVRKVVVLAHEVGILDRIELTPVVVSPVSSNEAVAAENPLVKVPTLVLDTGETLFDSAVIVEYLDSLHDGPPMFPSAGPERWTALRRQAIADGILDAALLVRYEAVLRPEDKRWPEWSEGQMRKIRQGVAALDAEIRTLGSTVGIGEIAVACTLGYLDFRFASENWRKGRPALAEFYEKFCERPSMVASRPPAG